MTRASVTISGHACLTVTAPDGTVTARAETTNTVVSGGLIFLAQILAGTAFAPRFQAVIGTDGSPTASDMTTLMAQAGGPITEVTGPQAVDGKVVLQAVFPPPESDLMIREAGLELSCTADDVDRTTLYNRALVSPALPVRTGETLTVDWTLTFAPAAS